MTRILQKHHSFFLPSLTSKKVWVKEGKEITDCDFEEFYNWPSQNYYPLFEKSLSQITYHQFYSQKFHKIPWSTASNICHIWHWTNFTFVAGKYLGTNHDFNKEVLKKFVQCHEFNQLLLVQALRQFLWSFRYVIGRKSWIEAI